MSERAWLRMSWVLAIVCLFGLAGLCYHGSMLALFDGSAIDVELGLLAACLALACEPFLAFVLSRLIYGVQPQRT